MGGCKFTFKPNNIACAKIDEETKIALEKTAEYLHTEVVQAQVIPFDTGHMQNETILVRKVSDKDVSLVVNAPYAERLYYHPEYKFGKASNPNAKGRWFEDWIKGEKKDDCAKFFAKTMKESGSL